MSERNVVIVDDDSDHALIVRLVLHELAPLADVTVFGDRRDLGARLEQVPEGALVLLDRRIDGTDGCALIAPLRAARPDLRVVLLSAHLGEQDRARALAAGALGAHEKPASMTDWRTLLSAFVTRTTERAAERPQPLAPQRTAAASPALGAALRALQRGTVA
jgi:two-component system response regulator RegA